MDTFLDYPLVFSNRLRIRKSGNDIVNFRDIILDIFQLNAEGSLIFPKA